MKKLFNTAQNFTDCWCDKFSVPRIPVEIITDKEMEQDLSITENKIYLNKDLIKDENMFVYALLHEIMHWVLYHKSDNDMYRDESVVEVITNEIYKEFYGDNNA